MTRYHIIIEDGDGNIVGQFATSSNRRDQIVTRLPDDLSVKNESKLDADDDIAQSITDMSDNTVKWDSRLDDL